MKDLLKSNRLLVLLFSIYLATGVFILICFSKGEFELMINKHHHPYLDYFFFYITYLGDGIGSAIIVLLMFLRRTYYGILGLLSLLVSTVIVQGMKRLIFAEFPRPIRFFEENIKLHLIEGLEIHEIYSFPSGHSSGAFSVFIILCLVAHNKMWSICYFLIAFMVAFSRIYLMQHFFIDTFIGAIIGTLSALFAYFYIQYKSYLPQKEFLQRPLLEIFGKR